MTQDSRQARAVHCRSGSRRGFSLVEALISIAILSLSASALLLAAQSASVAANDAWERTVAEGIARQLIDEALGLPYTEKSESPQIWPLSAELNEIGFPLMRFRFDDTDDFNWYLATPPRDAWHIPLGQGDGQGGLRPASFALPAGFFSGWRAAIRVTYADESQLSEDLPPPSTSGARAIQVTVSRWEDGSWRVLAQLRRVYSHVPALP